MNDILEFVARPWHDILMALIIFSLAPDIVLRLFVLVYPKNSERRNELVAELRVVPRWERPFWVTEQLAMITAEGWGDRLRARRHRRAGIPAYFRTVEYRTGSGKTHSIIWLTVTRRDNAENNFKWTDAAYALRRIKTDSVWRDLSVNLRLVLLHAAEFMLNRVSR